MKILKKPYLVGIDLGSSSLKMVLFQKEEGRLILKKVKLKEVEGNREAALRLILHGTNPWKSRYFVTFNSPRTAVRIITAPEMPVRELRRALTLEAGEFFPFPIEPSAFDAEVVGRVEERGVGKSRVAAAASSTETLEKVMEELKKAGVLPSALLPFPCALHRLALRNEVSSALTRCLIDIGECFTELVILRGGALLFSRKIPVAGRDFTTALTGTLVSDRGKTALTLEEAEKIKREIGIPSSPSEAQLVDGKITTAQIASMLQAPLERLTGEIGRCFDYFQEETEGGRVERVELYGSGAGLGGLTQFLFRELNVEVKTGDPLEGLSVEVEDRSHWKNLSPFGGAIGAALGEMRGINLVPDEIKHRARRFARRMTVQSLASAAALLAVFLYIGMHIQMVNYDKRISTARLEHSSLRLELEKAAVQSTAHRALADEPHWEEVFREFSHVIPDGTVLWEMSWKNRKLTVKGTIRGGEREAALNGFIRDLESGIFKNVNRVTSRERPDESVTEFELAMEPD